ncbi:MULTISPECIES: efflux RND transporter permease subunit [unclassified Methylophaga]|jgi:multidrug efflux pump|uniref:efflux RND transporter permease subunit n=5 Tax=Methylophaga TaxID=40222 RepID=UPI000C65A930|nr:MULTISPECIES: efflux RND transporter permease subunit [unclassified Methylophaga]MAL49962.1 hydrophobe/amphiphile efflux-1 family RND transporter [Methylophaga sp.]MBP26205.1 hydrophobe/amphiphile efflux-1 family RND transporter [Methylophaga sp.]MDX1751290.1 efflux RND transporter permease subunit [Methylophaga sp.]|tara:strand:+ start:10592 stop:13738 length:3147 start_codon:yes stop_codon:yes gene_type:complete
MARFFIDHPIFAWVIAILIMLAGLLSIFQLPIAQYPGIAPTAIEIRTAYPGASAKVVEDSVIQVIEQNLTGLDDLQYINSTSDSSGVGQITVTFQADTDPDIAQVQVQNKLQAAMPLLPQDVQQQGIRITKSSTGFLMVLGFVSNNGKMDRYDIADYVAANIQDPVSRVNGVGQINLFGSQYAMRIWLNANNLANYKLTTEDVVNAIREQNVQIAAGEIGGTPAVEGQQIAASIVVETRMETVSEFENILLRVNQDGSEIRIKDVANVSLGGENFQFETEYNKQSAAGLGITLASGANALETSQMIRDRISELEPFFPEGLEVTYPYDTTPFVKISIEGVVKTLVEAMILVFLVMYLFLQNFRATLIPAVAVPVVILGTFGILFAFGFSINMLTMFAMVLAIGLLVDDAIVVVENVERVIHEDGLSPKEATRKSMDQITGALVGIVLTVSAVFIPMAFFPGSTGVIYRQFSITVVAAMALSLLIALTLTPALCASLLKDAKHDPAKKRGFFGWFNRSFEKTSKGTQSAVGYLIKRSARVMLIYLLIVAGLAYLFTQLPSSFFPDEDQGILFTEMQLPVNASKQRSIEVMNRIEDYYLEQEGDNVESVFSVIGYSFSGRGQNSGLIFVNLKSWDQRTAPEQSAQAIANRASGYFSQFKDAVAFAIAPPPIRELGNASGFNMMLQDLGGMGHEELVKARDTLLMQANQDPRLNQVRHSGLQDRPQFKIDINHQKAMAFGVSLDDINSTFGTAWGSTYVNDFIDKGRVKRVYVQGDAPFRMMPEDVGDWYVRNISGEMVPLSAISDSRWIYGSPRLERYNGVPAMNIQGQAAAGLSSGEAMQAMEELVDQLPEGFGYEWTALSLQERASGAQAPLLYALSILVVFLFLAALYESWSVPFSVMLVVPLGVLGAVLFALSRGMSNDIYFQVGLLTTIGLSARNAILIVEFAKSLYEEGKSLSEATLEAIRMRLRPIAMTALTFMLGVTPLMLASGAGSGAQNAIGTGVFGGMLAATSLAIFFIPVFFVVIFTLAQKITGKTPAKQQVSQGESA